MPCKRVDEMGVDKMEQKVGVDKMGVDEMEVNPW